MMTSTSESLRSVMRQWATGVALVTALEGEKAHGMTVSSLASVSLSPPMILVCLEKGTRTEGMVRRSGRFAVNILAANQQDLSDRFAGRITDEGDRFAGVSNFPAPSGLPIVEGCLAYLDCKVAAVYEAGTHTIVLGEVNSASRLRAGSPLVYFNGGYRSILL